MRVMPYRMLQLIPNKKHINLQLGAGVDKLFETLIDDKFINFKFRKRVMDICRDWSKMSDDIGVLQ